VDPGVRDHNVEPAQPLDGVVDGPGQLFRTPNIGLDGHHAAIKGLHGVRGLAELLGRGQWVGGRVDLTAEVDGEDVGALLGEAQRVGCGLTAGPLQ
jgi:hypothetical protein